MERIKQYAAAGIAGALALIFLIVGALALTVFKPAQELASSVVPGNALVMTREGVLPLIAKDVVVTAESRSGRRVAIGVGTPGDVLGWIGDDPYTEIVGLTSDRSLLKTVEHGRTGAQSGVRSGAAQSGTSQSGTSQSAARSGAVADPQAASLVDEVSGSDMWLDVATNDASASLDLTNVPAGRSLLAVSAGGADDLELTLTWPTSRVNTLAIVSLLGALVLVIVTGVLWLSRFQILRHRARRAERLAARAGADITETQSIDTRRIAEMVRADETARAGAEENEDGGADLEGDAPSEDSEAIEDSARSGVVDGGTVGEADDAPAGDRREDEAADPGDESDEEASGETGSDEETAEPAPEEGAESRVAGRHGTGAPIDEDPPEKVPTDTGVIDLSAIRPGAALPSRRALREAREKGEGVLVVDGKEFDTGLIPVVKKPEEAPADGGAAPPAESEAADRKGRAATSAWTSMMAGWLKKDEGRDER